MPTAQERDEQDAQDPFARSLKEPGYRIAARIERPPDRRPQIVTALVATTIVLAIVVAALRIQVEDTASLPSQPPLASGIAGRIPTPLPALTLGGPTGSIAPFPVLSGGLRWLDPRTGTISGPPFSGGRGWVFAGSDGTATCVCYDSPWSATGTIERTTIVRYGPTGAELSRTTVGELDSPTRSGGAIARDVAMSADGRDLYVASVVQETVGWAIELDRIGLTGSPTRLATLDLGGAGMSQALANAGTINVKPSPVVRVSPDGHLVRVAVRYGASGSSLSVGWHEMVALVDAGPATDSGGGDLVMRNLGGPGIAQDPDRCDREAFVTPTTYAELCRITIADSIVPMALLYGLDDRVTQVQVGQPVGRDDLDWLVNATSGVVYRWSRFSHIVARLDVRTASVTERVLDGGTIGLAEVPPDSTAPASGSGRAAWDSLASAGKVPKSRLAGSVDGSILYAVGAQAGIGGGRTGPLFASTGIWAFDAQTLGLVAHWPAAAMYDQVGVTPDGLHVLAVGLEGMTPDGRLADWDSSLVIHDAVDGSVVEQIGHLVGDEGFFVDLLAPGPAR